MHRRPFRKDAEATKAAHFESRYSYISTRIHPGSSHQCVYLAGYDTEPQRRTIFERDGFQCQDCGKSVPWDGDLTVRGHLAHEGNTKITRCWCPEALKTKCYTCHMGRRGHNREVMWSVGIGRRTEGAP